jgi:hypothetical protein
MRAWQDVLLFATKTLRTIAGLDHKANAGVHNRLDGRKHRFDFAGNR